MHSGAGDTVTVFTGAFVVFFSQDGHKPGLYVGKPGMMPSLLKQGV